MYEDRLVEKPNLTGSKLENLKSMQRNGPLGNNVYFEKNRIAFESDQK